MPQVAKLSAELAQTRSAANTLLTRVLMQGSQGMLPMGGGGLNPATSQPGLATSSSAMAGAQGKVRPGGVGFRVRF